MQQANRIVAAISAASALAATGAVAQSRDTTRGTPQPPAVTIAPGPSYAAGGLKRTLLGPGWRELWVTPVRAPVLDVASYAGGLKFDKRGGGAQSLVLHFTEENGWREYRFRSVNKFPMQAAPPELDGSLAGRVFQDHVSILLPAAPLLVHPLLRSIGVIHVQPELYVLADNPRLGKQRDSVVGLLGTFELKGSEAPDSQPGFAGSRKIKGTEKFFEDLDSGREHRLDEREFLAARLIDMLINDPDRTPDNYDWARFGEAGAYTWRPLPRDRDHAFVNARGWFSAVLRPFYPKLVTFGPDYSLSGLLYATHALDRRLLQRLTIQDFRDVAARVQRAVHDSVIGQVIAEMPPEWRAQTTMDDHMSSVLRARRDQLPVVAEEFYRKLAGEVDVHATDDADRVEVVRHADGRVTVTVTDPEPAATPAMAGSGGRVEVISNGSVTFAADTGMFYRRTFLPGETREIRIFAKGGHDVALVRGAGDGQIVVRVIGGEGDDVLTDAAGGDRTFFYDAEGTNTIEADESRIDRTAWKALTPEAGLRIGSSWKPDWGGSRGLKPSFDYNTGSGLILGVGPHVKEYGFRRLPYHWSAGATLWVSPTTGRLGVTGRADYNMENSPHSFRLEGRATQLEATRFFGYGNDTPTVGRDLNLAHQTELVVEPTLVRHVGWRMREDSANLVRGGDRGYRTSVRPLAGEIGLGAIVGAIDPKPAAGSPLLMNDVRGGDAFGLAGVQLGVELDRTNDDAVPTRGWTARANVAGFPMAPGLGAFGTAMARTALYLPLTSGLGPHIALRAGGSLASGDYPAQYAASIGGRSSVRGYSFHRFTGDAGAHGSAELRVPVGTLNFIVKSKLGLFALADAGRVWFEGRSDGGWHTGVGGGFWLSALGRSISVAYAQGEGGRLYVRSGMFY